MEVGLGATCSVREGSETWYQEKSMGSPFRSLDWFLPRGEGRGVKEEWLGYKRLQNAGTGDRSKESTWRERICWILSRYWCRMSVWRAENNACVFLLWEYRRRSMPKLHKYSRT